MKKTLILCIFVSLILPISGQTGDARANTPVPFTLADRDRLIKLEVEVQAVNNVIVKLEAKMDDKFKSAYLNMDARLGALNSRIDSLDTRIDALDTRIDSLERLMYVIIAGIFGLIGFTVWDRRTFNLKLEKRVESLEKRSVIYNPK